MFLMVSREYEFFIWALERNESGNYGKLKNFWFHFLSQFKILNLRNENINISSNLLKFQRIRCLIVEAMNKFEANLTYFFCLMRQTENNDNRKGVFCWCMAHNGLIHIIPSNHPSKSEEKKMKTITFIFAVVLLPLLLLLLHIVLPVAVQLNCSYCYYYNYCCCCCCM